MVIALAVDPVTGGAVHGVVRLAAGTGVGTGPFLRHRFIFQIGEIGGDAGQICVAEILAAVSDHFPHGARDRFMLAAAGFQQIDQRLLAVTAAANIGGIPAIQRRTAQVDRIRLGQRFLLHAKPARSVAAAAVTGTLHQIGAAVPLFALARHRGEAAVIVVDPVPAHQRPAHVERPGDVALLVGDSQRLYLLHQVVIEIFEILIAHLGVGGVGHGRIEAMAIAGHPFAHHLDELRQAVVADTVGLVGGDVGGKYGADGGREPFAARQRLAGFAGVTGSAIAQLGHVFPRRHGGGCVGGKGGQGQQQGAGGQ